MSEDRCPDCGAPVAGGREGCQALINELAVQGYSHPGYAAVYNLAFDTYCLQHPGTYCRSAKSYAAHLTRLCCGLEHDGRPAVYAAINRWLDGRVDLERPETLPFFGQITIADVRAARTVEEHQALVRTWAESVWEAYAAQHDLARRWLGEAVSREKSGGPGRA